MKNLRYGGGWSRIESARDSGIQRHITWLSDSHFKVLIWLEKAVRKMDTAFAHNWPRTQSMTTPKTLFNLNPAKFLCCGRNRFTTTQRRRNSSQKNWYVPGQSVPTKVMVWVCQPIKSLWQFIEMYAINCTSVTFRKEEEYGKNYAYILEQNCSVWSRPM